MRVCQFHHSTKIQRIRVVKFEGDRQDFFEININIKKNSFVPRNTVVMLVSFVAITYYFSLTNKNLRGRPRLRF